MKDSLAQILSSMWPCALGAFAATVLIGLVWKLTALRGLTLASIENRFYRAALPVFGGLLVGAGWWIGLVAAMTFGPGISGDVFYSPADVRGILMAVGAASGICLTAAARLDRRKATGMWSWFVFAAGAAICAWGPITVGELRVPILGTLPTGFWTGDLLAFAWLLVVIAVAEVLECLGRWVLPVVVSLASLWYALAAPQGEVFQQSVALALLGAMAGLVPLRGVSGGFFMGQCGARFVGLLFGVLTLLGRQKAHAAQFIVVPVAILLVYVLVDVVSRLYQGTDRKAV